MGGDGKCFLEMRMEARNGQWAVGGGGGYNEENGKLLKFL